MTSPAHWPRQSSFELIRRNVMGLGLEAGGHAFWLEQLEAGNYTRAEVMLFFSQSDEFKDLTGSA